MRFPVVRTLAAYPLHDSRSGEHNYDMFRVSGGTVIEESCFHPWLWLTKAAEDLKPPLAFLDSCTLKRYVIMVARSPVLRVSRCTRFSTTELALLRC